METSIQQMFAEAWYTQVGSDKHEQCYFVLLTNFLDISIHVDRNSDANE